MQAAGVPFLKGRLALAKEGLESNNKLFQENAMLRKLDN